jgi:hypothetical protein
MNDPKRIAQLFFAAYDAQDIEGMIGSFAEDAKARVLCLFGAASTRSGGPFRRSCHAYLPPRMRMTRRLSRRKTTCFAKSENGTRQVCKQKPYRRTTTS